MYYTVKMKKKSLTPQEKFWKGSFGSEYIKRHDTKKWIVDNKVFFNNCLKKIKKNNVKTMIEFGSNVGLNLMALNKILNLKKITGIEINNNAYKYLKKLNYVDAINTSALNYKSKDKYNLVLSKGFLIHINPKKLKTIYSNLYNSCVKNGLILVAEYYSPKPVSVNYRGNKNVLFKRDFAGEILNIYKNKIKLIDYGFTYHRDTFPQDDITWFLFKKK